MDAGQVIITMGAMAAGSATIINLAKVLKGKAQEEPKKDLSHDCTRTADIERNRTELSQLRRELSRAQQDIRDLYNRSHHSQEIYHQIDKTLAVLIKQLENLEKEKEKTGP